MKKTITLLFLLYCFNARAQYFQNINIEVNNSEGVDLKSAWAGGLNNPQFSSVDLNNDGLKDLFIFDRTGNKVLTFINGGTPNETDYVYSPQFEINFPVLTDWALMIDYNCDNIEDIFTYTAIPAAGIKVYKGYYDGNNRIAFSIASDLLTYPSNNFDLNLYVSSVDIPAIADINGDGDIDVVTFHSTGGYVLYCENQSKEKGFGCDSLIYSKVDDCWGDFYEPSLCLPDSLNIPCPFVSPQQQNEYKNKDGLHSGSTELAWDNNGDGAMEFLKGDISCNNLVYMVNSGTPSDAHMISEDIAFPSYNLPADIFVYPAPFLVDVNNDGLKDLLAAPNAAGGVVNYNCSWYWKNEGDAITAAFNFIKDTFLVDEMIDMGEGAYPAFFDADADGLKDMLIGNRGYFNAANVNLYDGRISFYKNTGTSELPSFKLVTKDYASISLLNIKTVTLTFGDIDGDGDDDMISGTEDGVLLLFKNIAGPGAAANFIFFGTNYGGIDVGNFSVPQLVDVNRDGLLDLLIGESSGNLNYYLNTGTATNAVFTLQTTSFGNVKVNQAGYLTGYSIPFLFDDNDGNGYQLFVGSERGTIYKFQNIDNNLTGAFTLVDSSFNGIDVGTRSSVAGADVNGDSKIDLLIGNYRGGVGFYDSKVTGFENEKEILEDAFSLYPNPATSDFFLNFSNVIINENKNLVMKDLLGNTIMKLTLPNKNSIQINTKNISSGVFFLVLSTSANTFVRKLILNK